jgi:hypothetical protein
MFSLVNNLKKFDKGSVVFLEDHLMLAHWTQKTLYSALKAGVKVDFRYLGLNYVIFSKI